MQKQILFLTTDCGFVCVFFHIKNIIAMLWYNHYNLYDKYFNNNGGTKIEIHSFSAFVLKLKYYYLVLCLCIEFRKTNICIRFVYMRLFYGFNHILYGMWLTFSIKILFITKFCAGVCIEMSSHEVWV